LAVNSATPTWKERREIYYLGNVEKSGGAKDHPEKIGEMGGGGDFFVTHQAVFVRNSFSGEEGGVILSTGGRTAKYQPGKKVGKSNKTRKNS